jgi:hypothetical protein
MHIQEYDLCGQAVFSHADMPSPNTHALHAASMVVLIDLTGGTSSVQHSHAGRSSISKQGSLSTVVPNPSGTHSHPLNALDKSSHRQRLGHAIRQLLISADVAEEDLASQYTLPSKVVQHIDVLGAGR